jgi:capsular polysaccharide export protein
MVVINSTSGFSALHHNIPLLVMGDAVYRHSTIATVGRNAASIVKFLKLRTTKDRNNVLAFLDAVKAEALLPGDFYHSKGRKVAAKAITGKIQLLSQSHALTQGAAK